MSPRSLFIVILRVLGILMLKDLLLSLMELISSVYGWFNYGPSGGLLITFFALIGVALTMWIAYWLLFKPGELVGKFGLDKDFTESSFVLQISAASILHIALVTAAAITLVSELPDFVRIIYQNFREQSLLRDSIGPDWSNAIFSGVKIIMAFLIIGERKRIVAFLLQQEPKIPEAGQSGTGDQESI